jgi:hypothetical protein
MNAEEVLVRRSIGLISIGLVALFASAAPSRAQTAGASGDVSAAYASLTDVTTATSSDEAYSGWLVSGSWRVLGPRLFATGEVGSNSRKNVVDETARLTAYLGGARYVFWRTPRFAAFGHAVFGVEQFSEPGFDEWGPAIQPGGGLDVGLTPRFSVRVQSDYRFSTQADANYREVRWSVGGVFNLHR